MATQYELDRLTQKIKDDTNKLSRLEENLRLEERKKGDKKKRVDDDFRRAEDEIKKTEDLLARAKTDAERIKKDGERELERFDDAIMTLKNDIARLQEVMRTQTGQLTTLQKTLERALHDA